MFIEALNDLWIRAKKSIESQQKIILLSSTGILKYIFSSQLVNLGLATERCQL